MLKVISYHLSEMDSAVPEGHGSSKSDQETFTIAVEGNIGVGKSTLLEHFEQGPFSNQVTTIPEPVAQWQNVNGTNLLQLKFDYPERWCLSYQSYVLLTMLQGHDKTIETPIKIMERSAILSRRVFVENFYRRGMMTDTELAIYDEWYDFLLEGNKKRVNATVDLFVYIRADPEVCYERVLNRSRTEEASVSIEFVNNLHELHEEWYEASKDKEGGTPIHVIDANKDLKNFPDLLSDEVISIISYYNKR